MTDADKDLAEAVPSGQDIARGRSPDRQDDDDLPDSSDLGNDPDLGSELDLLPTGDVVAPPTGSAEWVAQFVQPAMREQLIRMAIRIGARDLEEAAEAVSVVMVSMLKNASTIGDYPLAYARTAIIHFLIQDRERRQEKRLRALATRGAGTPEVLADPLSWIEDIDWVMSLLETLPAQQRKVMALYYDGYSPKDIASILGVEPTNVRSNLLLARRALKKHEDVAGLHRAADPSAKRSRPDPDPVPDQVIAPTSSRKE